MSSTTPARREKPIETPGTRTLDMKLEAVVIPVSDASTRQADFTEDLGWRLDGDFVVGDAFRADAVHASRLAVARSISAPASRGRTRLRKRACPRRGGHRRGARRTRGHGVEVSEVFHRAGPGRPAVSGRHPERQQLLLVTPPSGIRTAMSGCCRRSPRGCPAASTPAPRNSLPQRTLRPPCGALRKPMASTKSATAASTTELAGLVRRVHGGGAIRQAAATLRIRRAHCARSCPRASATIEVPNAFARDAEATIDQDRRRFLGTAAMAVAAAQLALTRSGIEPRPATRDRPTTSFGAVEADRRRRAERRLCRSGPADGPPSSSCTAGPTTSTPMSMSRRCWPRRATA